MTAIIDGKMVSIDLTRNARGGTELICERMIRDIPNDLLSLVNVVHSRVNEDWFGNDKPNILVLHDLPSDPESAHLSNGGWQFWDAIVCVSAWQRDMYTIQFGIPNEAITVIRNGIDLGTEFLDRNPSKGVKLIYHTTPHRGLEILTPVFEEISKNDPKVFLDVYSSFNVYGWAERDEPYKPLFDKLKSMSQVVYHGSVSNELVRQALAKSHIFAYPSIWPETSCLAAIEAQMDGLIVVAPNYAALPETIGTSKYMYDWTETGISHMERLYSSLMNAIDDVRSKKPWYAYQNIYQNRAKELYQFSQSAEKWCRLIDSILSEE